MSDDAPDLDVGQREALAAFERDADVFGELGTPRADDAARISAWVDNAVANAGGVGAATASASKVWLVGGAIALVAGSIAAALLGGRPTDAPIEAPVIEAPIVEAEPRELDVPAIEAPAIEPPAIEARAIAAPAIEPPAPARTRPRERPTATVTAADLLRDAAALRRDGKKTEALALYRRIGREFPRSREDTVSKVAIGRLELDLGHPDRALAAFDAYLRERSTGNVAEEAAFGRASALRTLGRSNDEREALRAFIARFPDSVQIERARTRLAALGG